MRLRAGQRVLWRGKGASQVGGDPAVAVVLDGLSLPEQALLDTLEQPASHAEILRRAQRLGVAPDRAGALLAELVDRGALTDTAPDPGLVHRGLGGQLGHWSRIAGDGGTGLLKRRQAATVAVLGLDRVGLAIAGHLAAAGVGTLLVEDSRRVTREDVAVAGYRPADVSRPRAEPAVAMLRAAHPWLRTSALAGTRPEVVVLVEQDVNDPVRQRPLLREDVAHLLVALRELDVAVGPFVVPGRGACGRCADLHRTDADERWPAVATQLLASPVRGTEATAAGVAGGVAAGEVLAHLDGRPVATAGATLYLDPRRPVPQTQRWPVHPRCGCTGLPADEPDGSGDGGVLPRPAPAPLGGHDLAADEDLPAPHAPRLLAGDSAGEAGLTDRTASA